MDVLAESQKLIQPEGNALGTKAMIKLRPEGASSTQIPR